MINMKLFSIELKIININAQGFIEGSHFEQILLLVEKKDIDIISIVETWLSPALSNKLIEIEDYKIFRSVRNNKRAKKKKGGGVCCYVRKELKVLRCEKSFKSNHTLIDFCILEIQSVNSKFLFCNIYRHNDNDDSSTNQVFERIIELSIEFKHAFVCGDFNANFFDTHKYAKLQI